MVDDLSTIPSLTRARELWMLTPRRLIATILILGAAQLGTTAQAGCFDWLFGPRPTYVSQFPAVPAAPVVSSGNTYSAGFGPITLPPSVSAGGVVQAQRPAYFDNANVYSGRPAIPLLAPSTVSVPSQTAFRAPLTAAPAMSTTAPMMTNAPVYAAASPAIVPAPASRGCCLSRLFGSLRGTDYRSSYYRAPITYYRPVTSFHPVTGVPVTVQQPCTSTVQRLQRTPVGSVQWAPAAQPATGCPTTTYPSTGCPTGTAPQGNYLYGAAPSGNVGQVGGMSGTRTPVAPIPSSVPGYAPAPPPLSAPANVAPLSGTPPGMSGDQAPVDRPELPADGGQGGFRATPPQPNWQQTQPPPSLWESGNGSESTASLSSAPSYSVSQPAAPPAAAPISQPSRARYTDLDPIPAPRGYQPPPQVGRPAQTPPRQDPQSNRDLLPSLPPPDFDSAAATSVSTRERVAVRDAALTHRRTSKPMSQPGRSSSGWRTVNP